MHEGLHRLATLRLRSTPNNEAYCERVPVDLLRRWHLRTTSSTGCGLQLAAETIFEIVKANDNNNILAFRLVREEHVSTLFWESSASDFFKVSMTICWSLIWFELNSVARESSVVTVVLIVTRRSMDSSLVSKAARLINRLSILVFRALRVERTNETKSWS